MQGIESDFDRVLFWARLAVAQARKSPERFAREAGAVLARREREQFLAEFLRWRESEVFTPREKIAIEWGEAVAGGKDKKEVDQIGKNARELFADSEIIQLNLTVQAINDWFDNHAFSETYVLIIQPDVAASGHVREQVYEGRPTCKPVFAASTREAMAILSEGRRPRIVSKLTAIVIDVSLPLISAAEFMKWIKRRADLENLPVVVTTSSSLPEDIDECEKLRFELETDGAAAVNVDSVSDAFTHIAEHHRANSDLPPSDTPALEPIGLLQIYERLRKHFDAKK